jgi:hypothetical protein
MAEVTSGDLVVIILSRFEAVSLKAALSEMPEERRKDLAALLESLGIAES